MSQNLDARVASEKTAYNSGGVHARSTRLQMRFSHVFACPNAELANRYFEDMLARSVPNSVVLEYGCFNGYSVPSLARLQPRSILGIDISDAAIAQARAEHGQLAEFEVMDAHRLGFADGSIGVLIGRAVLHHLDFATAIREVHRVLEPGGKAVFIEPLRDNPMGKLLRALTPAARTRDELPLSRRQIVSADRLFSRSEHFFGGLASVGCGLVSSLVSSNPANLAMRAANQLDLAIASSPLRWWMRMAVLCWTK